MGPCTQNAGTINTGIRIAGHSTELDGLYKSPPAATAVLSWTKDNTTAAAAAFVIRPASPNTLKLYDAAGTARLTLTVTDGGIPVIKAIGADGAVMSGVTVTYGKLMTPLNIVNGVPGPCVDMMPGEPCDVKCNEGFMLNGSFLHDGNTFTHTGTCARPEPDGRCTVNAGTIGAGATFAEGSSWCATGGLANKGTCAFTCAQGYYFAGSASSASSAGSNSGTVTCTDSSATVNGTCRPYDSGIFVTATGPEGGHYTMDEARSGWYKDGDAAYFSIVAADATTLTTLYLKSPSKVILYLLTVVTTATTATLVVKDTLGKATGLSAEFVCGPPGNTTCVGFSKETAASLGPLGSVGIGPAGSSSKRSFAKFITAASSSSSFSVVLFQQEDKSWVGTSSDKRLVHVLGTKVTILSKASGASGASGAGGASGPTGIVTVEYEASGTGLAYVLKPVAASGAATGAATGAVELIATFDVSPIVAGTTAPSGPSAHTGTTGTTAPSDSGLSTAAIVGIAFGCAGFVLIVIAIVLFATKRPSRRVAQAPQVTVDLSPAVKKTAS